MKNITYKDIAEYIGKSEGTIKNWNKNFPSLLALVKLGAFCKKNDLSQEKIEKLVEIQDAVKGVEG